MLTSLSNAKVKQVVQWQNKAKERRNAGVFLTEGAKMYSEAPDDWIREVYVTQAFLDRLDKNTLIWKKLLQSGYEIVSDEVMEKMTDTKTPQGILSVLNCPHYLLEDILYRRNGLFLVLEELQDPGNLGTILRTGEGAGISGVIMSRGTVDIFNPKTIRGTMGSIYRVPFIYVDDLQEIMQKMKELGIKTYAAHLSGKEYYTEISFREPTAFLIGNEGNGLSDEIANVADTYIKIPMEGEVESLNAGVAAALLMYEAKRQRSIIPEG